MAKLKLQHFVGLIILTGCVLVNLYLIYERRSVALTHTPIQVPPASVTAPLDSSHVITKQQSHDNANVINSPKLEPSKDHSEEGTLNSAMVMKEKEEIRSASKQQVVANEKIQQMKTSKIPISGQQKLSWSAFSNMPLSVDTKESPNSGVGFELGFEPVICSSEISDKMKAPRLPDDDFHWCRWALDPKGGKVVVGKSWGTLKKAEQQKFDKLNCNGVNSGKNPSCDDSWGDIHITNWQKQRIDRLNCNSGKSSDVKCVKNDNNDVFCEISNAMIDFSKVEKVSRPGNTPSKKFQNNFLSADCKADKMEPDFPFPHLYSPKLSRQHCDTFYNGTLLMYSHDDIRNLGHTLNDVMNVWIAMWMSGIARNAKNIDMMNIDSFKLGHNFDDQPNPFFSTYRKSMHDILKGIDFKDKTVCVKRLLVQPTPPRFFIWESWFVDMPCSFLGPSTLYQRWNLHVRQDWGLVSSSIKTTKTLKVLLIVRNEHSNMWGNQRTSRNYLNLPELDTGLRRFINSMGNQYELVVQDLSKLNFYEQLQLLSETSIMVGMHGAGIASSMHMSIGTKYCCGVLEIYPQGEFFPILGHGNMARKMGIHYDRYDLSSSDSQANGAHVPVDGLIGKLKRMIGNIVEKPTCIRKEVIENPYLEG